MKNVVTNFLMLALIGLFLFSCEKDDSNLLAEAGNDLQNRIGKVDICHRTGNGSSHVINVDASAIPAHLAHGDVLLIDNDGDGWVEEENDCVLGGDCDDNDPTIQGCQTGMCQGFMTLTQEQWGDPNSIGGTILTDEFANLAGIDLIIRIGCNNMTEYDNGADLITYLPDHNPISGMNASFTNNKTAISQTVGELIALRLNLAADAHIPSFSSAESSLANQQYIEFNNYFGLSVNQILSDGQQILTGCLTNNMVELTAAAVSINGSYANGNTGEGILFCPFGN